MLKFTVFNSSINPSFTSSFITLSFLIIAKLRTSDHKHHPIRSSLISRVTCLQDLDLFKPSRSSTDGVYLLSCHSIFEITNHNLEKTLRVIHVVPIMMCNARFEHCPRFVHPTTSPGEDAGEQGVAGMGRADVGVHGHQTRLGVHSHRGRGCTTAGEGGSARPLGREGWSA